MTVRDAFVSVVGLGYAGLPLALTLVDGDYKLVSVHIDGGESL